MAMVSTNLLEAIAYCGIGKSVHFHRDEFLCEKADFFDKRSFSN